MAYGPNFSLEGEDLKIRDRSLLHDNQNKIRMEDIIDFKIFCQEQWFPDPLAVFFSGLLRRPLRHFRHVSCLRRFS